MNVTADKARSLLACVVALALQGCPNGNGLPCVSECERGASCDTTLGQCVPEERPVWQGTPPGASSRLVAGGSQAVVASYDRQSGSVVVTTIALDGATDSRILATLPPTAPPRVELARSGRTIAVLWSVGDRFEIAHRPLAESNEFWTYEEVDGDYSPTSHFDLVLHDELGADIVFQNRMGMLQRLHAPSLADQWDADLIDGAGTTEDDSCPAAIRSEGGRGVGFEPAALRADGDLYVAYHDADCGDLRLARRSDGTWVVSVVDTGEIAIDAETTVRGNVGRFPSIARAPTGEIVIAYQDVSRGRLLVASSDEGAFLTDVADSGTELDEFSRQRKTLVGAYPAAAFNAEGRLAIAYFDGSSGDLRLTRRVGSNWTRRTLSDDGLVGLSAQLVDTPELGLLAVAERTAFSGGAPISELVIVRGDQ